MTIYWSEPDRAFIAEVPELAGRGVLAWFDVDVAGMFAEIRARLT